MPLPAPGAAPDAANGPAGSLATSNAQAEEAEKLAQAANGASKDGASSLSVEKKQQQHHHHVAPPPPPFSPFLLPFGRNAKLLTLIRHAQGYHNAAGERDRESYKSELYRDAHLTRRGWRQAEAAGEHWRAVYSGGAAAGGSSSAPLLPRPELVVVSPLTRTLETACAIFGEALHDDDDEEEEEEEDAEGGGKKRRLLMRRRPAIPGRVAPAPAFSADRGLPFVALELCREESGLHPCDGRLPISQKREAFPGVDFSLVESEEDSLYESAPPGEREPKESVKARALEFARWLLARPERHVAVVSHAGFLHFFAQAVGAPHFSVVAAGGGGGGGAGGGADGSSSAWTKTPRTAAAAQAMRSPLTVSVPVLSKHTALTFPARLMRCGVTQTMLARRSATSA